MTRRLIEHVAVAAKPLPHERPDLARLTEREREIVTLVGEGLSNQEIARRLVVSPATAKTHVSRSMVKLGVRDRAQLVVLAYESGLVRPGLAVLTAAPGSMTRVGTRPAGYAARRTGSASRCRTTEQVARGRGWSHDH